MSSEAYIYDAVRTPRGRGKSSGALYTTRPIDLLTQALVGLRDRTGIARADDVVIGCVTQTGEQGGCLARFAALQSGLNVDSPGVMVNRFCASGLEAVNHAAVMVASGHFDCVVAGGVESMSRVEMGSDGGAIWDARTQWSVGSVPQGVSADLLATLHGVSRLDVDTFAIESHRRACDAQAKGYFAKGMIPVRDESGLVVLDRDETPRADTTIEALTKLKPSFEMMGRQFGLDTLVRRAYPTVERIEHIHHAGNSSGIVDGAAAVLIASKAAGDALGLRPRARIRSMAVVGDEPFVMLTGPLPATRLALKKAGMTIADIDQFEVNEAFAAVPIVFQRTFDIDPAKVNPLGGAIALGHPLGATGAMLVSIALDNLERTGGATALLTLCVGGGMGIATILERV